MQRVVSNANVCSKAEEEEKQNRCMENHENEIHPPNIAKTKNNILNRIKEEN